MTERTGPSARNVVHSPGLIQELKAGAVASWRENRPIIVLAAGYGVVVEVLSRVYGFPHSLDLYHKPLVLIAVLGALAVPVARVVRHRPERPFPFMLDLMGPRYHLVERTMVIGVPVVILALMMSSFSSIKSSIQLLNNRYFDALFVEWDRALHGGVDPWVLLHPVLGYPAVTWTLDWLYGYWLGITMGVLAFAIFMKGRPELRMRFITAWVLSWMLIGTVGAVLLNSVGPCFYGLFFPGSPDPFAPLMAYLDEAAPVSALSQQYLWENHQNLGPGFGTGISAMPSMHVTIAALQAVFLWQISRAWGLVAVAYAAIVLIGSVHLGWHYAIDGYVAIALVPTMWWLGGRVAALDARPAS